MAEQGNSLVEFQTLAVEADTSVTLLCDCMGVMNAIPRIQCKPTKYVLSAMPIVSMQLIVT